MRKTFVLLLLSFSYASYAQITTRDIPSSTPAPPKPAVFDSSDGLIRNKSLQKYVGQEIFFLPKKVSAESQSTFAAAYKYIYTKLPNDYKVQQASNTYKPINEGDKAKTAYNAAAGKYFKILEVIDKTEVSYFKGGGIFLKLETPDTKDVVYLDIDRYTTNDQYRYVEYIIAGTFVKLQQLYLNQTFYVLNDSEFYLKEINTGASIRLREGEEVQCTDVTLLPFSEGEVYRPGLIFKNKEGKELAFNMTQDINMYELSARFRSKAEKEQLAKEQATQDSLNAIREKALKAQYAKEDAAAKAEYIRKYGEKYGSLIANGQVAIGMNKEMCVAAWGRPTDVNSTTSASGTRDQYVYRDTNSYLYFENGKLVTIQK